MADVAADYQLPSKIERIGDLPPPAGWSQPGANQWWTKPQAPGQAPLDASVKLPTLHLGENILDPLNNELSLKTGVKDNYSVSSDIAQLYLKNKPAIVRINTMDPKDDSGFASSAGTGSIIESSGIIATGYHVVKNATALRVKTADGKVYDATLLEADAAKDEALLQIKSGSPFTRFPIVKLAADSHLATPSEKLVGLGFPKNVDDLHVSLLTADKRMRISDLKIQDGLLLGEDSNRAILKTDGPVDKGDSGGPVFDRNTGEQIGIVNLNDFKNGNAYVTPIEDFQLFLAKTREKYGISLPVQVPTNILQPPPFFQPTATRTSTSGSGLLDLERALNGNR